MGGPIVRTGTTPKFWENWPNIFEKKKGAKPQPKAETTKTAKPAKKASTKLAAGKKTRKPAGKKK